jgi:hypothetical protein
MPSLDELQRRYRGLSDHDLLRLAREADDLTPEARDALESELESRKQIPAEKSPETSDRKVWENEHGHALTIGFVAEDELIDTTHEGDMRRRCREIAEGAGGGLIEAEAVASDRGPGVRYVYKTPHMAGFRYTGVLIVPTSKGTVRWTFTAPEGEMTGGREAVITVQLMSEGTLSLENYESSWAQDPYDPEYCGVDSRTLRYISDDPKYDELFPAHPLTAVRAVLRDLLSYDYDRGQMGQNTEWFVESGE